MRIEAVKELLYSLGCRQVRCHGTKVLATCPFEHEHSSGRDSHPSFVVFASDADCSTWNCSYPHATPAYAVGGMDDLVSRFAALQGLPMVASPWGQRRDKGPSLRNLQLFVCRNDLPTGRPLPEVKRIQDAVYNKPAMVRRNKDLYANAVSIPDAPSFKRLPSNFLDMYDFPEGYALKYLTEERGLTVETIKHWELLYDPTHQKVLLPIRDGAGTLVGYSRRALHAYQTPKYLHSKGFSKSMFLYGEDKKHREGLGSKITGIVVEGQFDVIRLWQQGYPAVAIFGASMSGAQAIKFSKMFSDAIILADGDKGGEGAAKKVAPTLAAAGVKYRIVMMPPGLDPGDTRFTTETARELLGPPVVDKCKLPWE